MKKPKPTRKAKKKTLPSKAQPLRSLGREIILKRMTSTFLRVTEGQQIDDALEDSLITNYHLGIGRGDVKPKPLLEVNVPEWGGSVRIRVMTAEDRESWELECRSNHKVESFRAKYLARCLCGENGERLFSDNEASMLGEKSAAVIGRLWEKAMQYNAPQEKITGNGYPLPPDLEAVIDHYVAKDKTANSQEKEERRNCFRQGFFLALLRYADELKSHPEVAAFLGRVGPGGLERADKAVQRLEDQEDHCEMLQAEGQAAKAENDNERSAIICKLYDSVRTSYPEGRKGNAEAYRAVTIRFKRRTDDSVTVRTVRDTVNKKARLSQSPRRKGKH